MEGRFEVRRTFIEGQGHLVEEVPIKAGIATAAEVVQLAKTLTATDVSLELARQVCEASGMVVVPISFLHPDQLAELKITPPAPGEQQPPSPKGPTHPHEKAHKLTVDQMVAKVMAAGSFEELNALMTDETRKGVMSAAEKRAGELKAAEGK